PETRLNSAEQLAVFGEHDVRLSPRDRNRRPCQQRHKEFPRTVVHPLRVVPLRGEVLVVEYRHGLLRLLKDLADFLEELPPRIEQLPDIVLGIFAMLPN